MTAVCRTIVGVELTARPQGAVDLSNQNRYFGGWLQPRDRPDSIVMAFPVEGWESSATVLMRQEPDGLLRGSVHGVGGATHNRGRVWQEQAWQHALAVLSLDVDGSSHPTVGKRDPVIGRLQKEHAFLRPVLFHSPYEAACSFIIGQRIRITQGRTIRQAMAREHGDRIVVDGETFYAFPQPQALLQLRAVKGISQEKLDRVHGVARAALDGRLDRARLRALPLEDALASVRQLRGVGDFFAEGIVLRGAGVVDALPGDPITLAGVRRFYKLSTDPSMEAFTRIAEAWRPYRMWCAVLVHASERRAHETHGGGEEEA